MCCRAVVMLSGNVVRVMKSRRGIIVLLAIVKRTNIARFVLIV